MAHSSKTGPGSARLVVLTVVLGGLLALTLAELLVSSDGVRKTRQLQAMVHSTRMELDMLRQRNAGLAAEVRNLKHGLDAAEERARADLGMIGANETFYQILGNE